MRIARNAKPIKNVLFLFNFSCSITGLYHVAQMLAQFFDTLDEEVFVRTLYF